MDFSPSSYAALEVATDLADHFHAELSLLNVTPVLQAGTDTDFFPQTTFAEEVRTHAEQRLDACVALLVSRGIQATANTESGNDVAGNIMMVIEREHIDMVVLSTHGMSGWRPLVFGSIAEKVVKLVQCPLMLLRSLKPLAPSEATI